MNDTLFDKVQLHRFRARALSLHGAGAADFLLTRVADDIAERLSYIKRKFPTCLDLGCHHGTLSRRLAQLEGVERVISMDSVLPLAALAPLPALAGDEEQLPFRPASFDLVASALTLQWVNDLPGVLRQVVSALKADGVFIGTVLGPNSLQELRHAMMSAEEERAGGASPRVAPFADVRDVGQLLQGAGFALPVTDRDVLTVRYNSAVDLMQDLRRMGASNSLSQRSRHPLTRGLLDRVNEIYKANYADADGRVRATFEIIYMMGWAPHPDQPKPLRPGSGRVSLVDVFEKKDPKG